MTFLFVKTVGFIPVFLAIGGFVFLVFLLSYHTLKRSLGQLEVARENFVTAGKQLYEVAKKLIEKLQTKGDLLNNYDKIVSLAGTLHSEQVEIREAVRANILLHQELDLIPALVKNLTDLLQDPQTQNLLEQMQNAEKDYQILYKKYAYNLKYYNNFVETLPSKWVALFLGYRKQ